MRLQSYDFFLKICQNIQEIFLSSSSASVSWVFVFKEIANTEAKLTSIDVS